MSELRKKIVSSSAMLGMLPEAPNFNGSVLMLDDEERDRICKDLDEAANGLTKLEADNAALRSLIDLMFESTLPYNDDKCTFSDAVISKWKELK